MRYLKTYNESQKYNPSLSEFISELDKELETIGFSIKFNGDDDIIEIGEIVDFDNSIYYDFNTYYNAPSLSNEYEFSIKALKKECNKDLDDDKSTWKCSEENKDKYDLLCLTILSFIDEINYGEIK